MTATSMKILITIQKENVASRFDLASEILVADVSEQQEAGQPRIILLPGPGGESLCGLAIKENVSVVICNGIEETHYEYLVWKKILVIDRIIGPWKQALDLAAQGGLKNGSILPGASKSG